MRVEHVAAQVDDEPLVPATPEADTSQATSVKDGLEIVKTHCTQCHTTVQFDQIKKSPAEWESALERMEAMGVNLSGAEKDTLLNYLIVIGKP
jgi:mono/diheme cytochrome c family protein